MYSGFTGHITASEWRWVILISSLLVLAAFSPFLWVALTGPSTTVWQFMGALHDYPTSAAHLSRMVQGGLGEWLMRYLHTPEPHNGVLLHALYISLGRIAQIVSLGNIITFHVARVGAALFMYAALYHLAATIWMRVRTRRLFFILATFGSGLGWLLAPLTQISDYPDITPSTFYPFHNTLVNVHYPLVIGALCILVSAVIDALRPGNTQEPSVTNSGGILFMVSLALSLFYLQSLLPLAVTFIGLLLARAALQRRIAPRELRWILWFGVPALPVAAYYLIVLNFNPVVEGIWSQQALARPIAPLALLVGLGLPLLIAVPGLARAVHRFEPDGSQVMLIWLVTMLLSLYLIPGFRSDFALGLMIPLAYFGARATEDTWFKLIPRAWRFRVMAALLPLLAVSHLYVVFTPIAPLTLGRDEVIPGVFLARDYALAFAWLTTQRRDADVVLAAPSVSLWLPAWTGQRVVYGFPDETLNPAAKRAAVLDWFSAAERDGCTDLLNGRITEGDRYTVRFVVYGPEEQALGTSACLGMLLPTVSFGRVAIYRYVPTPPS